MCCHGSVHSLPHLTFHLEFHPRYIGAVDALKTLQWGDLRHKLDEERGKEGAVCVPPRRQRGHWLGSLQVCSFWWHSCCSQSCCCCSVTQLRPALCDPMDCSTPGFPVLHCLLGFAQTHVHWVSDAIPPSHPLSHTSPAGLNLSQHQGLLQCLLYGKCLG